MAQLTKSAAWQGLQAHHKTMARIHMRDLFAQEPNRFERLSLRVDDLLLDYSKHRITPRTLSLLLELAREAELPEWIARMFRGDRINATERRAALHVALRNRGNLPIEVDGQDVMPAVNDVLRRLRDFVEAVRGGGWTGHDGRRITDVVSIGIGGSHLGPEMAVLALPSYAGAGLRVQFAANVDGAEIATVLAGLDPATTLFVVISKTFTTIETLTNARTARDWFRAKAGADADMARHFVAVSNNRRRWPSSASIPPTASRSGTGSAAATRCGRRSACRWRSPSASTISSGCSRARTPWTSISTARRSSATCPC
jgi:glucose-6-phosphate isomerase